MTEITDWSGERIVPSAVDSESFANHIARYIFASQYAKEGLIIDAACGAGYGSAYLSSQNKNRTIIGIDIDEDAVDWAVKAFSKQRTELKYQIGDINKLPFESESVDSIVSIETIEHLQDVSKINSEFLRCLKPGGVLIASVPDKETNTDAGELNHFHYNEMYIEDFKKFFEGYSSLEFFIQELPVTSQKLKIRSLIVGIFPSSVKAYIKHKFSKIAGLNSISSVKDVDIFIKNNTALIDKYYPIKEKKWNKKNKNRYVFVCKATK